MELLLLLLLLLLLFLILGEFSGYFAVRVITNYQRSVSSIAQVFIIIIIIIIISKIAIFISKICRFT
jgi:hypothetical protein